MCQKAALSVQNVTKRFASYTAIENITMEVEVASFVSIVGPSGCGKSTILNIMAGLLAPSEGRVLSFGKELNGVNRHAAYMFQEDALLPWKTALENIQLGLILRGQDRCEAMKEAQIWLERLGLATFGRYYPGQLSGGMRKRVALAQCWIVGPKLVLMDEPFSALDVHTRLRIEAEILALRAGSPTTVVLVTHDLDEAIALSDEVILLSAGPASRLVGRYRIDLPGTRSLLDIKTDSRFHELYARIWNDLREEVLKSHERTR